jgi:hypothetical protein
VVQKTHNSVVLLPSAFMFPKECGMNEERPCATPDSYVKHLTGSSWVSPVAYRLSRIYAKPYFVPLCIGVLLLILLLVFLLGRASKRRPVVSAHEVKHTSRTSSTDYTNHINHISDAKPTTTYDSSIDQQISSSVAETGGPGPSSTSHSPKSIGFTSHTGYPKDYDVSYPRF